MQAGYYLMTIMQFTLPEQSDWYNNMPVSSYDYFPVLQVNVSRPLFQQGHRMHMKNLVSGDKTSLESHDMSTTSLIPRPLSDFICSCGEKSSFLHSYGKKSLGVAWERG